MGAHNLQLVAKGLSNAASSLDGESFAKMQVELAVEMYPDAPTPGHALAKLMNSNVGREMVAKACSAHYEKLQHQSACGDAWDVQKRGPKMPAQAEHATSDPEGVEEPFDHRLKRLTDAGYSSDEAHSVLHRMEKLRRGY